MRSFIEDLQVWANNWVEEVQQVVVEHLDELFKDNSIRYLAKKYREKVENERKFNSTTLMDAYQFETKVIKHSLSSKSSYSETLYELCYKRFTRTA